MQSKNPANGTSPAIPSPTTAATPPATSSPTETTIPLVSVTPTPDTATARQNTKTEPVDILWVSIVIALLFGITGVIYRRRKGGEQTDQLYITEEPKNLFHYISATFKKHSPEYLVFIALPLIVGHALNVNLLSLLALWGILVTVLGAFYAARADYSSSNAFSEATKSHEEAKKTYLAVVNFAENLESFIEIVKHDLQKIEGDVTLKFLTVIPAFGTIGLKKYYDDMKRLDATYVDFPEVWTHFIKPPAS